MGWGRGREATAGEDDVTEIAGTQLTGGGGGGGGASSLRSGVGGRVDCLLSGPRSTNPAWPTGVFFKFRRLPDRWSPIPGPLCWLTTTALGLGSGISNGADDVRSGGIGLMD